MYRFLGQKSEAWFDIRLSFYADMALSTSWNFEDHAVDMEHINEKMVVFEDLRGYLETQGLKYYR